MEISITKVGNSDGCAYGRALPRETKSDTNYQRSDSDEIEKHAR